MKAALLKYAFITRERPTQFLTDTGGLSDSFDDALLLGHDEIAGERATLNDPDGFEMVKVCITAEV